VGVGEAGAGGGLGGWGGCADALRADERSLHKAESMSQGKRGGLVRVGFGFGFGFAGIRFGFELTLNLTSAGQARK
jgi:hypothetical protein